MTSVTITIDDEHVLEIPKTFSKYRYVRTIGNGSFSAVVLVQHSQTTEYFACKVVSRALLVQENIFDRFEQEVRVLQSLKHPNIVSVNEIVFTEPLIFLIMEFCQHGELFRHIVNNGALEDEELRRLFKQTTQALNFVHQHNIAHRDLKPENILLDKDMNAKLADFGLCHQTSSKSLLKTPCGSPFYAPPEIICNIEYDGKKADIWSLGVVLYTMSTGSLPWTETNQTRLFLQIQEADIRIPAALSPPLQQILTMMLCREPSKRPTCEDILKMPWLQDDDDDDDGYEANSRSPLGTGRSASFNSKSSSDATDSLRNATRSTNFKKPLNVRPTTNSTNSTKMTTTNTTTNNTTTNAAAKGPQALRKNTPNTISMGSVMDPIASLVRKVPPTGRRKPK